MVNPATRGSNLRRMVTSALQAHPPISWPASRTVLTASSLADRGAAVLRPRQCAAADASELSWIGGQQVRAAQQCPAGWRGGERQQAKGAEPGNRLAGAELAHKAKRIAAVDLKVQRTLGQTGVQWMACDARPPFSTPKANLRCLPLTGREWPKADHHDPATAHEKRTFILASIGNGAALIYCPCRQPVPRLCEDFG